MINIWETIFSKLVKSRSGNLNLLRLWNYFKVLFSLDFIQFSENFCKQEWSEFSNSSLRNNKHLYYEWKCSFCQCIIFYLTINESSFLLSKMTLIMFLNSNWAQKLYRVENSNLVIFERKSKLLCTGISDGSQVCRLKSHPFSPPKSSLRKCLKGLCWELGTTDFEGSPSKGFGPETAVHHFLSRSTRPRKPGQDTFLTRKLPCPCSLPSIPPPTFFHPRKLSN